MIKVKNGSLYQWDLNRTVEIDNPENAISEVHFCCEGDEEAVIVPFSVVGDMVEVKIPNIYLQSTKKIYVFSVYNDNSEVKTLDFKILHILPRQKPSDYVYEETEIFKYKTLENELKAMLTGKADLVEGKVPTSQLPEIASSWNDLKDKPDIPTKVSQLENDENYLKEHQDLSAYAKTSEVVEQLTDKADLVEGKVPASQLPEIASSWNDLKDKPDIPTKVSQLENDENYLKEHQDLSAYAKTTEVEERLSNKADLVEGKIPVEQIPDSIGSGGTAEQVQADWYESYKTSPAYVKNRTHSVFERTSIYGVDLNDDATYTSVDATKDTVIPAGYWLMKMVFARSDIYTIDFLSGRYIKYKIFSKGNQDFNDDINVKVTPDTILEVGYGSFAVMYNETPLLMVITSEMCGVDIGGGIVLPSNPGIYFQYSDQNPDSNESGLIYAATKVFTEEIQTLDEKFLPDNILRDEDLDDAINKALSQAKESGEFNGAGIYNITVHPASDDNGYNIMEVTLTDGTQSLFPFKSGSKGADGYTPQKGIDYFTDADKEELVSMVLERLGTG